MLCQNCGKNEANVKYTQIINGVKKQMSLCDKCAEELGINNINFNIPISFSNFLGDFFDDYESDTFIPTLMNTKEITCPKCNMTYTEFLNEGKFGCDECYETFEDKLDLILKNIQGANRHVGRNSKLLGKNDKNSKIDKNVEVKKPEETSELEKLNERLKQEIKEERYEDAAKTRDEIKKLNNSK